MANQLTMAKVQAIRALHEKGWRNRRIARELEIDRETVAKYLRAEVCVSKPAKAPIGSKAMDGEATEGEEGPWLSEASPSLTEESQEERGIETIRSLCLSD